MPGIGTSFCSSWSFVPRLGTSVSSNATWQFHHGPGTRFAVGVFALGQGRLQIVECTVACQAEANNCSTCVVESPYNMENVEPSVASRKRQAAKPAVAVDRAVHSTVAAAADRKTSILPSPAASLDPEHALQDASARLNRWELCTIAAAAYGSAFPLTTCWPSRSRRSTEQVTHLRLSTVHCQSASQQLKLSLAYCV